MSHNITDLITRNPRVLLLKKEAKALYKANKTTNSLPHSLTACQEVIAQKHGYKNWYHFYTTTKNLYTQPAAEFVYSKEPIKDALALGYDHLRGLNVYMPQEYTKKHTLILGEHSNDIKVQFTSQIINSGKPLIYLGNEQQTAFIDTIEKYGIQPRRQKLIRKFAISSNSLIPAKTTFPLHLAVNSQQLTILLGSFFSIHNDDIYCKTTSNALWKNKSNHFIRALSNMVCYLHEQKIINRIDFKTISQYLPLENFSNLYTKRDTLPDYVIQPLEYYLLEVLGYRTDLAIQTDSVQEQHGYIHMMMSMTLGTLFDTYGSNFSEQPNLQYEDLTDSTLFITFPNTDYCTGNLLISHFFLLMIGFQISNRNSPLDNMPTLFLDNLLLYNYAQNEEFPYISSKDSNYSVILSYSSKEALTGTKDTSIHDSVTSKIGTLIIGDRNQLPEITLEGLTFSKDILNNPYNSNARYIAFSNNKIYPLDIIKRF